MCRIWVWRRNRQEKMFPTRTGAPASPPIRTGAPASPPIRTGAPVSPPIQDLADDPYGGQYQQHRQHSAPCPPPLHASHPPKCGMFTYAELVLATNGFADSNLLCRGQSWDVHKGVLPNGREVAVKQLKIVSGQGDREFNAEVDISGRVHHKHLVSLVGFCISGGRRLLVQEFVPNNTLEFHLHGKGRSTMGWSTRIKIALGVAKALAYIHETCHPNIIHRNIKASNILVDYKFEAKLADFGLAKIAHDSNMHIAPPIVGSFGYLAPEYAALGKLTVKSDVFSYGVMLLEFITGKRPIFTTRSYTATLIEWARPLLVRALEEGNYDELVDPNLGNNSNSNEMTRMIECAAACVRHYAERRPCMS